MILLAKTHTIILEQLAWLFKWVITFFYNCLYALMQPNMVGVMGLTIIAFTVVTRLLLLPLSLKQQRSSRKMQRLQPRVNRIQAKYKDNKDPEAQQRMQAELSELYKESKTSPVSGCLPLLIQMPILFALYEILRNTAFYIDWSFAGNGMSYSGMFDEMVTIVSSVVEPATLAERFGDVAKTIASFNIANEGALKDLLSHFTMANWNTLFEAFPTLGGNTALVDLVNQTQAINEFIGFNLTEAPGLGFPGILWPIFAGVTTWLQSYLMQQAQNRRTKAAGLDPSSQNNNTMKIMNWIMPIFMAFIMINVPLGIGLYWVIGNIISIALQFLMDWILDVEEYKQAVAKRDEIEEKNRLREIAKANIDKKTGMKYGSAAQQAAQRSAMAGNRKAAAQKASADKEEQ